MERMRVRIVGVLASAIALCSSAAVRADQGGVSFWVPGIYASMAAVPLDPEIGRAHV